MKKYIYAIVVFCAIMCTGAEKQNGEPDLVCAIGGLVVAALAGLRLRHLLENDPSESEEEME